LVDNALVRTLLLVLVFRFYCCNQTAQCYSFITLRDQKAKLIDNKLIYNRLKVIVQSCKVF